jgi:hypothetical protein
MPDPSQLQIFVFLVLKLSYHHHSNLQMNHLMRTWNLKKLEEQAVLRYHWPATVLKLRTVILGDACSILERQSLCAHPFAQMQFDRDDEQVYCNHQLCTSMGATAVSYIFGRDSSHIHKKVSLYHYPSLCHCYSTSTQRWLKKKIGQWRMDCVGLCIDGRDFDLNVSTTTRGWLKKKIGQFLRRA